VGGSHATMSPGSTGAHSAPVTSRDWTPQVSTATSVIFSRIRRHSRTGHQITLARG
jgi:hypothetical protein